MNLAPGWYIAEQSAAMKQRPLAITRFARPLIARRDARGQAVVTDADRPLPIAERYGYVWIWHGPQPPHHPLPSFPLAEDPRYLSFRLTMPTAAGARRILESQYDAEHYITVHKVRALAATLIQPAAEPLLDARESIFSARVEARLIPAPPIVRRVTEALGLRMPRTFSLTADCFSSGCITLTRLGDDISLWVLLSLSPVSEHRTLIHELVLLESTGNRVRDALRRLGWMRAIKASNRQDCAALDRSPDELGDPYEHEAAILDFRRAYEAARGDGP